MSHVRPCALPEAALLRKYQDAKAYTDCYVTEVTGAVSQQAFVEAFYTTPLFKLERTLLRWFVTRASTDLEARQLAAGCIDTFAAWRVEGRRTDQLMLTDFTGRTRSWLMVTPADDIATPPRTYLYFGSAVVAQSDPKTGRRRMGLVFQALLGFHRLYSRLLLRAARSRILAARQAGASRGTQ